MALCSTSSFRMVSQSWHAFLDTQIQRHGSCRSIYFSLSQYLHPLCHHIPLLEFLRKEL